VLVVYDRNSDKLSMMGLNYLGRLPASLAIRLESKLNLAALFNDEDGDGFFFRATGAEHFDRRGIYKVLFGSRRRLHAVCATGL
jgi:hypothetical protein